MAYQLTGREWGDSKSSKLPCIFCGTRIFLHTARAVRVARQGAARARDYVRCEACPQGEADAKYEQSLWECTCQSEYRPRHENLGDTCATCGSSRFAGVEAPRVWVVPARLVFHTSPPREALRRLEEEISKRYQPGEGLMIDETSVVTSLKNVERKM